MVPNFSIDFVSYRHMPLSNIIIQTQTSDDQMALSLRASQPMKMRRYSMPSNQSQNRFKHSIRSLQTIYRHVQTIDFTLSDTLKEFRNFHELLRIFWNQKLVQKDEVNRSSIWGKIKTTKCRSGVNPLSLTSVFVQIDHP